MKIGITGGKGQFGFHLRCRLQHVWKFDVTVADRGVFSNPEKLRNFVADRDVIVHLAGVNRGTDEQVSEGNLIPAQQLADAVREAGIQPHLIFASSIQRDRDNVYGRAKAAASEILSQANAPYLEIVFPNLFGEYTRPNYNSFVGTFCNRISLGQSAEIVDDATISLLHYLEASDIVADAINNVQTGEIRPGGHETSIVAVAEKLEAMHRDYSRMIIPELNDPFDLRLFNCYRACLFPDHYPVNLTQHEDARGAFIECVKERSGGQTSFSTTRPGITRGDHFHFEKIERFLVIAGEARISVRRIYDDRIYTFDVSGNAPSFIDMPTLHTHNITNTGDQDLLTLFWSNDLFDPDNPDTYAEQV